MAKRSRQGSLKGKENTDEEVKRKKKHAKAVRRAERVALESIPLPPDEKLQEIDESVLNIPLPPGNPKVRFKIVIKKEQGIKETLFNTPLPTGLADPVEEKPRLETLEFVQATEAESETITGGEADMDIDVANEGDDTLPMLEPIKLDYGLEEVQESAPESEPVEESRPTRQLPELQESAPVAEPVKESRPTVLNRGRLPELQESAPDTKPVKQCKPTVLNRRQLPELPENWGLGFISDFKILEQIGEGTYGQVYKAFYNNRENGHETKVALKKIKTDSERNGFPISAIREIKILRQLDHKNVVRLLDIVTDEESDMKQKEQGKHSVKSSCDLYLVFEYVDHDLKGLLNSGLVKFSVNQIAALFKQLLLALEYCHLRNFLHRDIKSANILINNKGELKLADFGLARLYLKDGERLYTNHVITLWYRPPELLLGQERYGTEVDIWSAGQVLTQPSFRCILGELFMRKPIFCGDTELVQLEIIAQFCGSPLPEIWPDVVKAPNYKVMRLKKCYPRLLKEKFKHLPPNPLDLLDKLLQLDPIQRLSSAQALKHNWLINICPERVVPPSLPENQDLHEMRAKKLSSSKSLKGQQQKTTTFDGQQAKPVSNRRTPN